MSKATNENTTQPGDRLLTGSHSPALSRRGTLGALAAIAAIVPASAVARAVCPDDPIYMLIEEHKTAREAFSNAVGAIGKYQEANRTETGGLPSREGHPALVVLEAIAGEYSDREQAATVALLTVPPSSLPGAVALLRYLTEIDASGDDYMQTDCGEQAGYVALILSLLTCLAPLVQQ